MMFILPLHKCYRRDDRQDYHRHSFLQFHRTANTLTDVQRLVVTSANSSDVNPLHYRICEATQEH